MAAYAEPWGCVVCAPGLSEPADIQTLIASVAPKPVDIQLMKGGVRSEELKKLGVRRISVGHSLDEFRTRGATIHQFGRSVAGELPRDVRSPVL
jgi:2-methylisocitrate lyase-like PEP mutase family enzyme